jgi:hypothetical protein
MPVPPLAKGKERLDFAVFSIREPTFRGRFSTLGDDPCRIDTKAS